MQQHSSGNSWVVRTLSSFSSSWFLHFAVRLHSKVLFQTVHIRWRKHAAALTSTWRWVTYCRVKLFWAPFFTWQHILVRFGVMVQPHAKLCTVPAWRWKYCIADDYMLTALSSPKFGCQKEQRFLLNAVLFCRNKEKTDHLEMSNFKNKHKKNKDKVEFWNSLIKNVYAFHKSCKITAICFCSFSIWTNVRAANSKTKIRKYLFFLKLNKAH